MLLCWRFCSNCKSMHAFDFILKDLESVSVFSVKGVVQMYLVNHSMLYNARFAFELRGHHFYIIHTATSTGYIGDLNITRFQTLHQLCFHTHLDVRGALRATKTSQSNAPSSDPLVSY